MKTTSLRDVSGTWRSRGYRWLLEIGTNGFLIRDVTAVSSAMADAGGAASVFEAFDPIVLHSPDTIEMKQRGDLTSYFFDRCGAEAGKAFPPEEKTRDPLRNFDVLCAQFEENYAFFGLHGIDWRQETCRVRQQLTRASADDDLFDRIGDLLAPLKDAHVGLAAGDRMLDVTSPIRERKAAVEEAFGIPPWRVNRQQFTDGLQAGLSRLFLRGEVRAASNNIVGWGEAAPGVGYLTMLGEFGHAETERARRALDLPRPRLEAASFLADEIAALNRSMDRAVADLASCRALIVDVRFNYGGYDRLALEFAGRFTDRTRVAYRKSAWSGDRFVSHQDILVDPRTPSLSHIPVYLLTSRQTASAGEILVFGMMASPTVTRVGESTLGILSDNLYKRLPNGWELSLSNELYQAPDGAEYEGRGIPPEVETPVFDPHDVMGCLRCAVDRAIELARSR